MKLSLTCDVIIGIDPGLSNGGIAIYSPNRKTETLKMARTTKELWELLFPYSKEKTFVILEKVNSFRDDTDIPGKRFGIEKLVLNYEAIKNVLELLDIPYLLVHPASWQKELFLVKKGEDKLERKKRFKTVAQGKFKETKVTLWNADALLLVLLGKLKKRSDPLWIYTRLPQKARTQLFHN